MGERTVDADADIISRMPEEILSRLPTDEAVRTSVLSSRWKMRWTSIFNLHFDHKFFKRTKDFVFVNFVRRVFGLCQTKTIQNFYLEGCVANSDNCIDKWIRFAEERNVRNLDLNINFWVKRRPPFVLPCILTGKTLVELRLQPLNFDVYYVPNSAMCFPRLKFLYIWVDVYPGGDLVNKLLGSCPVLEELSLCARRSYFRRFRDILNVNVSMPTLKKLTISILSEQILEIRIVVKAPNLEHLCIYANSLKWIVVNEVPFISEVFVHLGPAHVAPPLPLMPWDEAPPLTPWDEANHAIPILEILRKINRVKFLQIPFRTIHDLNIAFRADLPTFPNLIRLELDLIYGFGRKPLPHFLNKLPNLEVLILKRCSWIELYKNVYGGEEIVEDFDGDEADGVPHCLLLHVKFIEILDYLLGYADQTEMLRRSCSYMKVSKYLLKNSKVLEKFSVKCNGSTRRKDIEREFHTFPKGSETCEIEVCDKFSCLSDGFQELA